jgi:hypothetical protein
LVADRDKRTVKKVSFLPPEDKSNKKMGKERRRGEKKDEGKRERKKKKQGKLN